MLCAECDRCGRRSLLDDDVLDTRPHRRIESAATARTRDLSLRCDLCGSRRVRVTRFSSALEALRFSLARKGA